MHWFDRPGVEDEDKHAPRGEAVSAVRQEEASGRSASRLERRRIHYLDLIDVTLAILTPDFVSASERRGGRDEQNQHQDKADGNYSLHRFLLRALNRLHNAVAIRAPRVVAQKNSHGGEVSGPAGTFLRLSGATTPERTVAARMFASTVRARIVSPHLCTRKRATCTATLFVPTVMW